MTKLVAWQKKGQEFIGTPQQLVNELTYTSYKFNRQRSPDLTPDQWTKVYPNVDRLEARYQQEQT